MKTKNVIIISSIIVVVLLGIIYNLYSTNIGIKNSNDTMFDEVANVLTDEEMKVEFMGGCVEYQEDIPYCSCVYDYMSARTTNSEMLELAVEIMYGEMPDVLLKAVNKCIDLL